MRVMRVSEEEGQMLGVLRGQQEAVDFSVLIERRGGAWDIAYKVDDKNGASIFAFRGSGATFERAWSDQKLPDFPSETRA
jgi:hypothetical protein